MDADFPAAHSMDTEWFAVDAEGHVGHFSSGESGAVPADAQLDEPFEVWRRLNEVLPRCTPVYDLEGHLDTGPRRRAGRHWFDKDGSDDGALMFLKSLDPVKRQIASGNAFAVEAVRGAAVVFRRLTPALSRRLHKEGHCLGCFFFLLDDEEDPEAQPRVRPAEIGLFDYDHPGENWIALPYGRKVLPSRPLHIDQLPPDLRRQVGAMRFDKLRFAETTHLQPCEWDHHLVCWEPAYLSADGKHIRELGYNFLDTEPTYEEFYANHIAQERDWLKGITIHPPRKR